MGRLACFHIWVISVIGEKRASICPLIGDPRVRNEIFGFSKHLICSLSRYFKKRTALSERLAVACSSPYSPSTSRDHSSPATSFPGSSAASASPLSTDRRLLAPPVGLRQICAAAAAALFVGGAPGRRLP